MNKIAAEEFTSGDHQLAVLSGSSTGWLPTAKSERSCRDSRMYPDFANLDAVRKRNVHLIKGHDEQSALSESLVL